MDCIYLAIVSTYVMNCLHIDKSDIALENLYIKECLLQYQRPKDVNIETKGEETALRIKAGY